MSHTILTAHRAIHSPIRMHEVTQGIASMKNNDAFVDNTDGYADVEQWTNESEYEVVQTLQNKRNPVQN